jgi:hypothetical protein
VPTPGSPIAARTLFTSSSGAASVVLDRKIFDGLIPASRNLSTYSIANSPILPECAPFTFNGHGCLLVYCRTSISLTKRAHSGNRATGGRHAVAYGGRRFQTIQKLANGLPEERGDGARQRHNHNEDAGSRRQASYKNYQHAGASLGRAHLVAYGVCNHHYT